MRRCLDEGDVPALHDGASFWVQDSVRFSLLAIAAHFHFQAAASSFRESFMCTKVLAPMTQRYERSTSLS